MFSFNATRFLHLLRPRSFGRFLIVGGLSTAIGIASFPVLYWMLSPWIGVNVLLVLAWAVSTACSFLLHKLVTFQSRGGAHHEGVKFLILSLGILAINLIVMNVALRFTTAHPVPVQVATSILTAITLMILNYLGMNRLIFRSTP
jgi:putative flippase GtrA